MSKMTWLFDLDDTLIDHEGSLKNALRSTCCELGSPLAEVQLTEWIGLNRALQRNGIIGNNRIVQCLEQIWEGEVTEELTDTFFLTLAEKYPRSWVMHEDAKRFIARNDITPGAIITNGGSSRQDQMQRIKAVGLEKHFSIILMPHDGYPRKPHPQMYEVATRELSLRPDECVYVGDLPDDCRGAYACGMHGVVVSRGTSAHYHEFPAISSLDEIDSRFPSWFAR